MGAKPSRKGAEEPIYEGTSRTDDLHTSTPSFKPPDNPTASDGVRPAHIPHVFKWSHGGQEVFLTGTFNAWREKIPMIKDGTEFSLALELPPGYYEYKFIVNNQWQFAPDQPATNDAVGNVNNYIEITTHTNQSDDDSETSSINLDDYAQYSCEPDEFIREPPELPSHLRFSNLPLNQPMPESGTLRVPSHVIIGHTIYGSPLITTATINNSVADNGQPSQQNGLEEVTRLAITHRFRGKFVTTILHKPISWRQKALASYIAQSQGKPE
eukprot:c5467_g1_i1.p1 GENE.c5467_g1_i1~~c5467_g1_i1.p1  ORF type:complete len:269 (-),score=64.95 c5467_g1_i1:125-931(-)